jgi:hypothetical protein
MDIQSTASGATRSKTIYLGLAITVIGYIQSTLPTLAPWVEPHHLGVLNMILGLGVIVVRFFTSTSLEDK